MPTLVVLVPGLMHEDTARLREAVEEHEGNDVLVARCAAEDRGIAKAAHDLAEDVRRAKRKRHTHVSVLAVGTGGLVARYAVALLYDRETRTIEGLAPDAFCTCGTPHIGLAEYGCAAGPGWQRHVLAQTSETLREVCLLDGGGPTGKTPVVLAMSAPEHPVPVPGDLPFLEALQSFARRRVLAAARGEAGCAWRTAALTFVDPPPLATRGDAASVGVAGFARTAEAQEASRVALWRAKHVAGCKDEAVACGRLAALGWERAAIAAERTHVGSASALAAPPSTRRLLALAWRAPPLAAFLLLWVYLRAVRATAAEARRYGAGSALGSVVDFLTRPLDRKRALR